MPLFNILINKEIHRYSPSAGDPGGGVGFKRRQIMFTMCRHLFPNRLFCNKLYMCKLNLTIGKDRLRFFFNLDGTRRVLIKFT